jgi:hypothetical protein
MTKELGCEILIAEEVCVAARIARDEFASRELAIRGRDGLIAVRIVARANLLSPQVARTRFEAGAPPQNALE